MRWLLIVLFAALAVPSVVLVTQAYRQMRWETYHQHRLLAEELTDRLNTNLAQILKTEEERSFADYDFLVISGDAINNFVQPSVLAAYPVRSGIPGLVGYFQVDGDGAFSSPLLPESETEAADFGISPEEYRLRLEVGQRMHALLSEQQLVRRKLAAGSGFDDAELSEETAALGLSSLPVEEGEPSAYANEDDAGLKLLSADTQRAFSELQQATRQRESSSAPADSKFYGRLEDIELDSPYVTEPASGKRADRQLPGVESPRQKRKEQVALPSTPNSTSENRAIPRFDVLPFGTFETELEPFSFARLDADHFVMFRKVWRGGDRFVQGAIIERTSFVETLIGSTFSSTTLSTVSDLFVAFQGDVLQVLARTRKPAGSLLYRNALQAPFADIELVFGVTTLPLGPGGTILGWSAGVLLMVLLLGFVVLYRMGLGLINLNRQQHDFVAAVSHELKTPLTSIRMYGEMLREGWVSEDKRKTYYDFIFHESERLSRLIANVLQLARLSRHSLELELEAHRAGALLNLVQSKIASQVEGAGFELVVRCAEAIAERVVDADEDAFCQIVINLVDNALKFSATGDHKVVELSCQAQGRDRIVFAVRDYGPGVPRDQLKKIFRLFYRSESELTRETVGTGIGLALVRQLTDAMGGTVDVVNREPRRRVSDFLGERLKGRLSSSFLRCQSVQPRCPTSSRACSRSSIWKPSK